MKNYFNYVQKAAMELGDLIAPLGQELEDLKGLLTRRAAYYINLDDPNIGLLAKTTGNNSKGFSVDIVMHKVTGEIRDTSTDVPVNGGLRRVVPVWGEKSPRKDLLHDWRNPTRELAGLEGTTPTPTPTPNSTEVLSKLAKIHEDILINSRKLDSIIIILQKFSTIEYEGRILGISFTLKPKVQ